MTDAITRSNAALRAVVALISEAPAYAGQVCINPAKVNGWMLTHAKALNAAFTVSQRDTAEAAE